MENSENKINLKAEKFIAFLKANNLNFFWADEKNDELNTILFRSDLLVNGQKLPLLFVTDDSIYSLIKIKVAAGTGVEDTAAGRLLPYLNELNGNYKIFKYSLNKELDIVLDISLPTTAESFDPQLVQGTLNIALQHLTEELPVIMRKLWGN